jgi:acetyl esterase/lipase
MTVYPPKGRNTGAAVVVFPGGGFVMLAITLEGTEICDWFASRGMTCILSKYRVPGGNHHWDKACKCHLTPKVPFALQDAQRTIRLVRAHAEEWHVDPKKVGVIGFSAGGFLVAQTSNIFQSTYAPTDAADTLSSRPDFAIAAYPGHLCRDGTFAPGFKVTARTTPTFLVQDWDDPVDPICNSTTYARALNAAGVPAEVHLFAKGGHAFGLRPSGHPVVAMWPVLVEHWLREIGILPAERE